MIGFEFDEQKSRSNLEKHGIDFHEAQELWNDPSLIQVKARSTTEPRYLVVARRAGKHWSAIITYREDRIRIISVRRSRSSEVILYES